MFKKLAVLFLAVAVLSGGVAQAFVAPIVVAAGCHHALAGTSIVAVNGDVGPILTLTVFGACALAAIWHIPAWEKAKANGTEAAYQASRMWPQDLAAKWLPHGNIAYVASNTKPVTGGYWLHKALAAQK